MNKYIHSLAFIFGGILILGFLMTILSYFDIIGGLTLEIIKLIIILISIFVGGFMLGVNSNDNGYLEGLKIGIVTCIMFMIYSMLIREFQLYDFLYYIIIIITAMFGSIIGINNRKIEGN